MTRYNGRGALALLAAVVGFLPLMAGTSWAISPCEEPIHIPNCVVVKYGPYGFTKFQHTQWKASCPEPNSLFLGNDDDWSGVDGYEVDNKCFSFWDYVPESKNLMEALVINWCDKPETVNLSLGCMPPGN